MSEEELKGKFILGEFVDEKKAEFGASLGEIIEKRKAQNV